MSDQHHDEAHKDIESHLLVIYRRLLVVEKALEIHDDWITSVRMWADEYKAKRDLDSSPQPEGK